MKQWRKKYVRKVIILNYCLRICFQVVILNTWKGIGKEDEWMVEPKEWKYKVGHRESVLPICMASVTSGQELQAVKVQVEFFLFLWFLDLFCCCCLLIFWGGWEDFFVCLVVFLIGVCIFFLVEVQSVNSKSLPNPSATGPIYGNICAQYLPY